MKQLNHFFLASMFFSAFTILAQNQPLGQFSDTSTLTNCNDLSQKRSLSGSGLIVSNGGASGYLAIQTATSVVPPCPAPPLTPSGTFIQVTGILGPDSSGLVTVPEVALLSALGVCSTPNSGSGYLCLYQNNAFVTKVQFKYDTSPSTLNGISLSAGNKQVTVTVDDPKSGTANYSTTYQVCYSTDKGSIDLIAGTTTNCKEPKENTSKTITVMDLNNFTPYYFIARVKGSSNQWTTPAQSATPINTDGFAEVYNGAPNPLSWSCAQTSSSPGTWMLLLVLGIFLRRKHRSARSLLLVLLLAPPVFADLGQINFSITGAPYKPNLDASTKPDGSRARTFYQSMFYDNLLPLMGVEVDVHLVDDFGSLQLGLGTSYTYAGGNALQVNPDGTLTNNRSSDSAGLHMLHLRPQLTYVLDPWVDYFPLVPYVRGGIVSVGYLFTYQGGIDKEPGGKNPMGFMFGWEAAGGLMFALDWLEPSVSKSARANGVYDHIYLKAEAAYMPINNFYQNGLDFSSAWPTSNIPLLLTFGLVFEFK